jgi:hypothetical protein
MTATVKTPALYTLLIEHDTPAPFPVSFMAATDRNAAWIAMAIGLGRAWCVRQDGKSIGVAHKQLCAPNVLDRITSIMLGLDRNTDRPLHTYASRNAVALTEALHTMRPGGATDDEQVHKFYAQHQKWAEVELKTSNLIFLLSLHRNATTPHQ